MTPPADTNPCPTPPTEAQPPRRRRPAKPAPDGLRLDPANANRGTERGRELVKASLAECGAGRSIVVDRSGTTIGGAKTLEAARALGLPVKIVESTGDELIAIQRTDLDLGADERARRLAYLDNRASELGLEWDREQLLRDLSAGLDLAGIFTPLELDDLLGSRPLLADPDELPEMPEQVDVGRGDIYRCGASRVMCGDATKPDEVAHLLDGARPRLLITDPPYGVGLDMEWRDRAGLNQLGAAEKSYMKKRRGGRSISNDTIADWSAAFELVPSLQVAYVWHATVHMRAVADGLERIGFALRQQIIWVKPYAVISRSAYNWRHEPCWYAVKKGSTAHWTGGRKQDTVWECASPKQLMAAGSEEPLPHPAQKPCECMARPVRNHSGDVYDPFLGSGTTLIAATQEGRACYGMELEPRYVALAVRRWELYSGKTALREAHHG